MRFRPKLCPPKIKPHWKSDRSVIYSEKGTPEKKMMEETEKERKGRHGRQVWEEQRRSTDIIKEEKA